MIIEAMPNLRSVSVTSWSDFDIVAEMMGSDYVFSRKPDLRRTYDAARDCIVELLFRDVYDVGGDRSRLARWVSLVKSVFDI